MFELIVCYVAGTAAGLLLFRAVIKERIVSGTLDMLIQEEYVRTWEDDEGITQLYTWKEAADLETWNRVHTALESMTDERMEELMEELEAEIEKDDTP